MSIRSQQKLSSLLDKQSVLKTLELRILCKTISQHSLKNANMSESVSNSSECTKGKENYNVLLATEIINVKSPNRQVMRCKELIDNASQNILISKICVNFLNLPFTSTTHQLQGINGLSEETCLKSVTFKFSPYNSEQFQPLMLL